MSRSNYIRIGIIVLSVFVLSVIWEFWLESYFEVFVDAEKAGRAASVR